MTGKLISEVPDLLLAFIERHFSGSMTYQSEGSSGARCGSRLPAINTKTPSQVTMCYEYVGTRVHGYTVLNLNNRLNCIILGLLLFIFGDCHLACDLHSIYDP